MVNHNWILLFFNSNNEEYIMFLELKKAYHADVKIKVELLTPVQEAEEIQTKFDNPETKYKLNVKNMGQTLYTKNPTDAD